jgi:hypothetical protein
MLKSYYNHEGPPDSTVDVEEMVINKKFSRPGPSLVYDPTVEDKIGEMVQTGSEIIQGVGKFGRLALETLKVGVKEVANSLNYVLSDGGQEDGK